jgi:Acyl-CoA dehydrogenase, C-terminal domain
MSASVMQGEDLELFERSLRAATEQHTGDALDAAVAELGWDDALSFDTRAAVSRLFALQGEACARSSALDRVVAFALGHELDHDTAVLLPAIGQVEPPAHGPTVYGYATSMRASYLVVASHGDGHVAMSTDALERRAVHGIDPDLGLVEVHGEVSLSDATCVDWSAGVQLAQVALAHELVGVSRRALALAREHALERIQFDQPIARFQAVRHRLAETLVAIETAAAVIDAAWLDPSPVTAAMAKATAGRSARVAAKHCQQVLAGIGFTTEHDLHRYLRRIWALDQLFGSSAVLTKRLGQDLLASRELPPLLPL